MFKNKKYKNPNKYIIYNNKFIKNFEKLYKEIEDPWNQTQNFENNEDFIFCLSGIFNILNKSKKNISVLDVGAADGILKKYLKKKIKYIGTDIHKKNLDNVIYDDINIYNKPFLNKFDVIFCLRTIYYVSDNIKKVISNFKKYLKKNGLLVISYNLKKNSYSNKYFNDIKLRKILIKNFKEKFTIEINRNKYLTSGGEKITIFCFKK